MARFYMKNWMEWVNSEELKKQINGRGVYAWDDTQLKELSAFLSEKGIKLECIIGGREELINKENYIIIAHNYRDSQIMSLLADNKLRENIDFTYIGAYTELRCISGYYSDSRGNEIVAEGTVENVSILLEGYNNRLYIGKDTEFGDGCIIKLKGSARVSFGRNIYMKNGNMFFRNSESIFQGDSYLAGNYFISNFEGYMNIGTGMQVTDGLYICVVENTRLTIGEGLLVAKDVKILSGGAHSLFDLDLKENINIKENVHVTIGNHVWLGMDSKIIYNTDIGDNSVVGAGSIVKGVYPSHCLMAGSIAKVLRTNVDWEREDYMTFPEYEELRRKRMEK